MSSDPSSTIDSRALLPVATSIRNQAIAMLEVAAHATRGPAIATGILDSMQRVANDLGIIESQLAP